mmetsp:Transcript_3824/g.11244  ORF Transcript_3824/g.11244 Transcript_3824/m.11244 type:complete len:270 (+) Transcript_3824:113-922(+)
MVTHMEPSDPQKKPAKPRISEEGVAIFQRNPYSSDGRELTGSILWDGGNALAKFVKWKCVGSMGMKGRVAVELGSGTGIVGLTLGSLGAQVMLTDCEPEILALLQRNIDANELGQTVFVHHLNFGDASTYVSESQADLVVAAEVLYEHSHGADLACAFDAHLSAVPHAEAFLAYCHRDEAPLDLFISSLFAKGFGVERLENESGCAVAGAQGPACNAYDGSHFRRLSEERAVDEILQVAREGRFSAGNEPGPGGGGTQIFRLSRMPLCH